MWMISFAKFVLLSGVGWMSEFKKEKQKPIGVIDGRLYCADGSVYFIKTRKVPLVDVKENKKVAK